MRIAPQQTCFEDIAQLDADPGTRRLLLLDKTWRLRLVDWPAGAQTTLPRFAVPDLYHRRTQGWRGFVLGASVLDLRLLERCACILTTEGLWTCELREDAAWVRVAGHPTDPPAGMTRLNRSSFDFHGPLALTDDRESLRCGSWPVALSADGDVVVGAPRLQDLIGCAIDYTLALKTFTRSCPEPVELPPRLRSSVCALDLSADGALVAFSEGRDVRVIRQGKPRASRYVHGKMYVRSLAISPDGRFVAASILSPTDFRFDPTRTVIWDVASRDIIDILPKSVIVGFVGHGEETRLVFNRLKYAQPFPEPYESALFRPDRPGVVAALPGRGVEAARGDAGFLVVRRGYEVEVLLGGEGAA